MTSRWRWLLLAWPGLPELWLRGSWAGLFAAFAFSVLVCICIATWLVWPAWLPPQVRFGTQFLLVSSCIAAGWAAWRRDILSACSTVQSALNDRGDRPEDHQEPGARSRAHAHQLFSKAQSQYLQGDWAATETTLNQLLDAHPRDIEARLLLATLYRHMSRFDEADSHLSQLSRLDASAAWAYEINTERRRTSEVSHADIPHETQSRSTAESPKTVSIPSCTALENADYEAAPPSRGLSSTPNAGTIGRIDAA